MSAGKGSRPRNNFSQTFRQNYDDIFRRPGDKQTKQPTNKTTGVLGKRPYEAANPSK
jgi:hypothetical protein